ncbi:MAG: hypothetical protein AAF441_21995 [Pseudomonadota bacterium]
MAVLDIYETEARGALQIASSRAATGPAATFGESYLSSLHEDWAVERSFSEDKRRFDVVQDALDAYYERTGEALPNPESLDRGAKWHGYNTVRERFESARANTPGFDLAFPDDDEIERRQIERGRDARRRRSEVAQRETGFKNQAASFLGVMSGAMTDPVNILAMMFGAGPGGSVGRVAFTEGGIALTSEAVIQASIFDSRRKIDPDHSIRDATENVLAAGLGGFVIGGGVRLLAKAWEGRSGSADRELKDAGNVVKRQAAVARSPFSKPASREVSHRAAVHKAAEDIAASRPVELPPEAFIENAARPGRLYTADGQSVGVQYEVVEARDLITSHQDDFTANEAFPPELQPRERERAISRDQIGSMSRNLQPERLGPSVQAESGAPVVGTDGIVESGNARVMAVRLAYSRGGAPADNYRNYLRSQGFDLDGVQEPVLVARRVTPFDEGGRQAFVVSANRPSTMRLSAAEQALGDARHLDRGMLDKIEGGDLGSSDNRGFVRGFMEKLPRSEQGSLIDQNRVLSQEGLRRVNAAVMARAYEDSQLLSRVLEDPDNNIRSLGGALQDVAPSWARMRDSVIEGRIPAGMDVTGDLIDAVRLLMRARDEGKKFSDLLHQAEMFGGPSEVAKLLGRFMFKNGDLAQPASRKALAEMLGDYAAEAQKNLAGQRLLGDPLETGDILQTALRKSGRDDLATIADERLAPENIEKLADDPEVEDQIVREAERISVDRLTDEAAAGDMQIPMVDEDGEITGYRNLSDLLNEADDELAAAKEIEVCVAGRPGEFDTASQSAA